jgi:hypothetical protein
MSNKFKASPIFIMPINFQMVSILKCNENLRNQFAFAYGRLMELIYLNKLIFYISDLIYDHHHDIYLILTSGGI